MLIIFRRDKTCTYFEGRAFFQATNRHIIHKEMTRGVNFALLIFQLIMKLLLFSFIVNWKQLRFHFFHWSFVCCLFACCLKKLRVYFENLCMFCACMVIKISIPVNLLCLSILFRMLAINFVSDLSSFVLIDMSASAVRLPIRVWHGTPPPPPPPHQSANHYNLHQRPEPWSAYIVSKTFWTLWNAAV